MKLIKRVEKLTKTGTRHIFTIDIPSKPTPEDLMKLRVGLDGTTLILNSLCPKEDLGQWYKPKELVPVKAKDLKPLTIYWYKPYLDLDDLDTCWYFEISKTPEGKVSTVPYMCGETIYSPEEQRWWIEKK